MRVIQAVLRPTDGCTGSVRTIDVVIVTTEVRVARVTVVRIVVVGGVDVYPIVDLDVFISVLMIGNEVL